MKCIDYNAPLFLWEELRSVVGMKHRSFSTEKRAKIGKFKRLSREDANQKIYESIVSGKPFFVGRFGSVEMRRFNRFISNEIGLTKGYNESHLCSPMFHKDPALVDWFAKKLIHVMPQIDMLGAWCPIGEAYAIRKFASPGLQLCTLGSLEPYLFPSPWSAALQGKKVLVVNCFEESIKTQYKNREQIFQDPNVLPEFDLKILKTPIYSDLQPDELPRMDEELERLYQESKAIDFDIALLGCGPIGMPLAAKFKRDGKQAIYMGGVIQILFGIKGKRWDNLPRYQEFYNDNWVYPLESPPENKKSMDNNCYWK